MRLLVRQAARIISRRSGGEGIVDRSPMTARKSNEGRISCRRLRALVSEMGWCGVDRQDLPRGRLVQLIVQGERVLSPVPDS